MLDAYLTVLGVVLPVVETVPVWGPLLLVGTVAVLAWLWRSARRAVPGHVPGDARTCADTDPEAAAPTALTCVDTGPDVSEDSGADVSGHEERSEL